MKVMCVSPTGNDTTGTGSFDFPYRTIEHAVSLFVSGDQIRLLEGTYIPTDSIIISGKEGSIFSDYPGSAIIQPISATLSAACLEIVHSNRFTVQGIEIRQDQSKDARIGILANDVDNFICYTCSVDSFDVASGNTYGIFGNGTGRIENCKIYDIDSFGDELYGIWTNHMHVIDCETYSLSGTHDVYPINVSRYVSVFDVINIDFIFTGPPIPPPPGPFSGHPTLGTGCLAHYAMENTGNDDTTTYNGSLIGVPTFEAGIIGQSIKLNGATQYINLGTSAGLTPTNISLTAWMKRSVVGGVGDYPGVIARRNGGANYSYFMGGTDGTKMSCGVQTAGGSDYMEHIGFGDPLIWHFFAFTYDGTTMSMSRDGLAFTTKIHDHPGNIINFPAIPVCIGLLQGYATGYFPGWIDMVGIWNRPLTFSEVQDLYNFGTGLTY